MCFFVPNIHYICWYNLENIQLLHWWTSSNGLFSNHHIPNWRTAYYYHRIFTLYKLYFFYQFVIRINCKILKFISIAFTSFLGTYMCYIFLQMLGKCHSVCDCFNHISFILQKKILNLLKIISNYYNTLLLLMFFLFLLEKTEQQELIRKEVIWS